MNQFIRREQQSSKTIHSSNIKQKSTTKDVFEADSEPEPEPDPLESDSENSNDIDQEEEKDSQSDLTSNRVVTNSNSDAIKLDSDASDSIRDDTSRKKYGKNITKPRSRFSNQLNGIDLHPSVVSQRFESVTTDRVTILDEPNTSKLQSIIKSGSRETTILVSKEQSPQDSINVPGDIKLDLASPTRAQYNQYRQFSMLPGSDNERATNLLSSLCIVLLTILGFILIYGWLSKRRTKSKINRLKGIIKTYFSYDPSVPRPETQFDSLDHEHDTTSAHNRRVQYTGDNGAILLIERNPKRSRVKEKLDEDVIEIEAASVEDGCDIKQDCNEQSKPHERRIVILKRQLAKHSWIVAAKSARPKAKLLRTRIKNFIDEEALELQAKQDQIDKRSIKVRILSILPAPLNSLLFNNGKKQDTINGDIQENTHEEADGSNENQFGQANQTEPLNPSDRNELKSKSNASISIHLQPQAKNDSTNQTACSSMSGLSHFQASGSPTSDDNNNFAQPHDLLEPPSACLSSDPKRICHHDLAAKSYSHDASSYLDTVQQVNLCLQNQNLIQPNQLARSSNCRSCYSASPTATSQYHQPTDSISMYNSTSLFPTPELAISSKQFQSQSHRLAKIKDLTNGYHLRRNYENYYDDEQADSYCLTASLGIDLARLGLQSQLDTNRTTHDPCSNSSHIKSCHISSLSSQPTKDFISMTQPEMQPGQGVKQPTSLYCCQNPTDFYMQFIPTNQSLREEPKGFPDETNPSTNHRLTPISGSAIENDIQTATSSQCNCQLDRPELGGELECNGQQMPSSPMNIFVQQPSLASRSPSPIPNRVYDQRQVDEDPITDRSNNPNTPDGSSHNDSGCQHELATTASSMSDFMASGIDQSELHLPSIDRHITSHFSGDQLQYSRRTSIAGDRISGALAPESCNSMLNSSFGVKEMPELQCHHHSLAHRASIASSDPQSGSHEVKEINQNRRRLQMLHNHYHPSIPNSNYQYSSHLRSIGIGQMSPVQQPVILDSCQPAPISDQSGAYNCSPHRYYRSYHRPSDCSSSCCLSQYQIYPLLAKGSACSSSGGSSSGIGVSGSACTNTPTSIHPVLTNFGYSEVRSSNWPDFCGPSGSMMGQTFLDSSAEFSQLSQILPQSRHQTLQGPHDSTYLSPRRSIHQTNPLHNQLDVRGIASRKFSLPIKLDREASDHLNAVDRGHRSEFIFSKDSDQSPSQYNVQASLKSEIDSGRHMQPPSSQFHKDKQRDSIAPDESSSRRSSQTITRQSSFWLEDGSFDSILSSVMVNDPECKTTQSEGEVNDNLNPVASELPTSSIDRVTGQSDLKADKSEKDPDKSNESSELPKDDGDDNDDADDDGNIDRGKSANAGSRSVQEGSAKLAKYDLGNFHLSSSSTSSSETPSSRSPDVFRSRSNGRTNRSLKLMRSNQISKRQQFIRSFRYRRNARLSMSADESRHVPTRADSSNLSTGQGGESRPPNGDQNSRLKSVRETQTDPGGSNNSTITQLVDSSHRSVGNSYDQDSNSIEESEFTGK